MHAQNKCASIIKFMDLVYIGHIAFPEKYVYLLFILLLNFLLNIV